MDCYLCKLQKAITCQLSASKLYQTATLYLNLVMSTLIKYWNALRTPSPNRWFWATTLAMGLIVLVGWLYPIFRFIERSSK